MSLRKIALMSIKKEHFIITINLIKDSLVILQKDTKKETEIINNNTFIRKHKKYIYVFTIPE